jgi:hypothetical protein
VQPRARPVSRDRLLDYATACAEVQEVFREVLVQLSGFALLLMMRRPERSVWAGSLDAVAVEADEARDRMRALRPPVAAQHQFHHLSAAADAIGRAADLSHACLSVRADDTDRDALLQALRAATHHLRATGRLLPGFELVDIAQACCAAHAAEAAPPGLSCDVIAS